LAVVSSSRPTHVCRFFETDTHTHSHTHSLADNKIGRHLPFEKTEIFAHESLRITRHNHTHTRIHTTHTHTPVKCG
jgi:hypothetical protein